MMVTTQKQIDRREARRRIASRFTYYLEPEDKGSLIDWGRHYLPHFYTCEPSQMHRELSITLDENYKERGNRYAVIGSRGSAKSTVVTLTYSLREAVQGNEPYILIVSDTEGQSVEHLRSIKEELEDNDLLADDYPHSTGMGTKWTETYIQLRNGTVMHAVGTGSRIRGRRRRQFRPSLIILDDPENDGHIESAKRREKTRKWFERTLMNMGDTDTNVVVMGTALHRESLVMFLTTAPGWTSRRVKGKVTPFKAIERWPKRMDLWQKWEDIYNDPDNESADKQADKFFRRNKREMTRGSKISWPDREPLYHLMKLRAQIGHASFDAEKQGNPIDPSTCEWPEKYFTHEDLWFDEWPERYAISGGSLDPSKGQQDKRHDYSAIVEGVVDKRGVVYVDVDMEKRSTDKITNDVVEHYRIFDMEFIGIEVNQFQSLLAEEIANEARLRNVLPMKIVQLNNYVKKTVRIRRLSPLLAQKRLRFKRSEGSRLCVAQLRDFPNGDHDDGPDAVEMFCRCAFARLSEGRTPTDGIGDTLRVDYGS